MTTSVPGAGNILKKKFVKGQVWQFGGPAGEIFRIRSVDSVGKTVALEYVKRLTNSVGDPDQSYPMKYFEESWELISHPLPTQQHLKRWLDVVR